MSDVTVKDTTSNPAPLGLMAFGMTTVLLNMHNAGLFPLGAMILGMGFFFGGLAQVIVGIMEWKKNNTFGTTAFTSFGLFWLSLVALVVLPKIGLADAPTDAAMAAYLGMWGFFTFLMFIGALKLNLKAQVVFLSLTVLFGLLCVGKVMPEGEAKHVLGVITGWEGVFCGLSAMYASITQVWDSVR